jgi:hypothetical protein
MMANFPLPCVASRCWAVAELDASSERKARIEIASLEGVLMFTQSVKTVLSGEPHFNGNGKPKWAAAGQRAGESF